MRLETGASVMERVKAMRSDEEFYAYVWEKYWQRHPKDGRRTSIVPPGGGYQYQSPTALPPRRLRSGRVVAAVVAVLAAAAVCGSIFDGRLLIVGGEEESEVSSAISWADVSSGYGRREMGLWYRQISAGYLSEGDCRAIVITDSEALQTHLRQVDEEGAEMGWTVEEDLSGLASWRPRNGRAAEVFDDTFFQDADLLVVEYTSSWQFPMMGTYVITREDGVDTLRLDAGAAQIECRTTCWQLFIPFEKGTAPQPETFTVQVNPPWDVVVRRVRTHFLEDEAMEKQPHLLFSRQELESLLTKWEREITGYWNHEDPDSWRVRYSEAFFLEHDLVILPLTEPSGSITHRVRASPTRLAIERQEPWAATCDMAYYLFFMEVPKGTLTPDSTVEVEITTVYEGEPSRPAQEG